MKDIKIIICSGGTGGHLFPAQATVESLLRFNSDKNTNVRNLKDNSKIKVSFFTDKRSLKYLKLLKDKIEVKTIYAYQFFGKDKLCKLKSLFFMSIGLLQTLYSFLINRPNVVVSFGGYISVPVLLGAVILRIPIILHEQNAILGRANRIFIRFCKVIATSFSNTIGLDDYLHKVYYIGLPIRDSLLKLLSDKTLNNNIDANSNESIKKTDKLTNEHINKSKKTDDSQKFIISILGGSQGAKIFSLFMPKTFQKFPLDIQRNLVIYHQCREEFLQNSIKEWNKTKITAIVQPFFDNIGEILQESSLIITRSGASTIAEINCFGKAAIYIPFKQAVLNHQTYNANAMVNKGCAQIIDEESLNFNNFNDIIINLLKEKSKIYNMEILSKKECKLNVANLFSNIIIDVAT